MLFLTWFVLGSLRYRAYAARHVPAPVTSRIGSPNQPLPTTGLHPDSTGAGAGSSFPSAAYTTGTTFLPPHPEPAPIRPHALNDGSGPDYSLRCRTVMVTNIPQSLRTPQMLRWYFGRYLPDGPTSKGPESINQKGANPWTKLKSTVRPTTSGRAPLDIKPRDKSKRPRVEGDRPGTQVFMAGELEMDPDQIEEVEARGQKLVENIVIAPKLSTLARLIKEREARIEELEKAHIHLAKTVMSAVATEIRTRKRDDVRQTREMEIRRRERLRAQSNQAHTSSVRGEDGGGSLGAIWDGAARLRISIERFALGRPDRSEAMDNLVQAIGPFVEEAKRRDAQYGIITWFKSAVAWLRAKISREPHHSVGKSSGAEQNGHHAPPSHSNLPPHKTVWDALYDTDPDDLNHYHPLTRRRSVFLYPLELIGILTATGLPTIDLAFRR